MNLNWTWRTVQVQSLSTQFRLENNNLLIKNFYSSLYIINFRVKKRDEYHRRRMFDPDAPIDFINERNRKFNHKLERYYGKYTEDIKEDLERGTAIWALLKDFTSYIINFRTFLSISFFSTLVNKVIVSWFLFWKLDKCELPFP